MNRLGPQAHRGLLDCGALTTVKQTRYRGLDRLPASLHDIAMDIDNLHERRLIAVGKKEQAMAWLVEYGPLHVDPPLPNWMLRHLVAEKRILRLRRGVYLAPRTDGALPALPEAIQLLNPDGYITGHAALSLHRLNDQDIAVWRAVSLTRQGPIRYGRRRVEFITSPQRAASARTTTIRITGAPVRIATIEQAFVDELSIAPGQINWVETARVFRNAVDQRKVRSTRFTKAVTPSVALSRRAGFLMDVAGDHQSQRLLQVARSHDSPTRTEGSHVVDKTWHLALPLSREQIIRASR